MDDIVEPPSRPLRESSYTCYKEDAPPGYIPPFRCFKGIWYKLLAVETSREAAIGIKKTTKKRKGEHIRIVRACNQYLVYFGDEKLFKGFR